jgi:hypothetical protein
LLSRIVRTVPVKDDTGLLVALVQAMMTKPRHSLKLAATRNEAVGSKVVKEEKKRIAKFLHAHTEHPAPLSSRHL